jgi:hypothetical protein
VPHAGAQGGRPSVHHVFDAFKTRWRGGHRWLFWTARREGSIHTLCDLRTPKGKKELHTIDVRVVNGQGIAFLDGHLSLMSIWPPTSEKFAPPLFIYFELSGAGELLIKEIKSNLSPEKQGK